MLRCVIERVLSSLVEGVVEWSYGDRNKLIRDGSNEKGDDNYWGWG